MVTCLEICWPLGFWFSGAAASRYRQPRAGRSATECVRGRGLSTLAATPADYALKIDRHFALAGWHIIACSAGVCYTAGGSLGCFIDVRGVIARLGQSGRGPVTGQKRAPPPAFALWAGLMAR